MRSYDADQVVARILEAQGGASTWKQLEHLTVEFRSGGLAFASKGVRASLADCVADMDIHNQRIRVRGNSPAAWEVQFDDAVQLRSGLERLRSGGRRLRWRPVDAGTFAAAAIFTYMTLPALLLRDDVQIHRCDGPSASATPVVLEVAFGDTVVSHSQRQRLHVGTNGFICRHDYVANAFGPWARAAQKIGGYRKFGPIVVGTRRVVRPRTEAGRELRGPTLVWIDVKAVHPR